METMKCTSCGETVLSTDKFCKQCGKANEQIAECKTETAVAAENPNKKFVLTFDALEQDFLSDEDKALYSIEVDDIFIGKLKPGEKLETFVRQGIHSVTLKGNGLIRKKEFETLVENNQIILLMIDRNRMWRGIKYSIANPGTQEQQRKEMREKDKKGRTIDKWIAIVMGCIGLVWLLGWLISLFD